MRSFKNIIEEILKNSYRVMHEKWASSTTEILNAAAKQKGEEGGGYGCEDSNVVHKNKRSRQIIFENNATCVKKKVQQSVKFCECTKQNILDYPCFSIIHKSSPLH
jgi:hypothetical protein